MYLLYCIERVSLWRRSSKHKPACANNGPL